MDFNKHPPLLHRHNLQLFLIIILFLLTGCSPVKKALQIKGSDTMVNLGQGWAEAYMNKYPLATIAINGGGSGTGISALTAGVTDIAQSSREMKEKEIQTAKTKGVTAYQIHTANDGIALIVNSQNPVNRLTLQQLSAIFSGKITNWQEVGGQNRKIVALSRERNSGTHIFFLEQVVKLGQKTSPDEFAPQILMMPSSQAIVEEVADNSAAIGYIGLGYVTSREKVLAIAKNKKSPYIFPSIKTILNNSYPVARALYFYTNGVPTGDIKQFVDFVLSKEGQQIVKQMDFVPIKKI